MKLVSVHHIRKAMEINPRGVARLAAFVKSKDCNPDTVWNACQKHRTEQILATPSSKRRHS